MKYLAAAFAVTLAASTAAADTRQMTCGEFMSELMYEAVSNPDRTMVGYDLPYSISFDLGVAATAATPNRDVAIWNACMAAQALMEQGHSGLVVWHTTYQGLFGTEYAGIVDTAELYLERTSR